MPITSRPWRTVAAFGTGTALVLSSLVVGGAAQADAPTTDLLAEYLFDQTSGTEVANSAPGATVGPAVVRNVQATDWTGSSLTMRGGAKTSSGNWVELPDDLLVGADSATITAEVRPSAAMLNTFHFLWNIGNENAATEYFFASLNCGNGRTPLVGIKSGGDERLVSSGSCGVTANTWVNVTSVIDGEAGTASLYLDGVLAASGPVPHTPGDVADQSLNTIGRAPWPDPLFQGGLASFRAYDRALTAAEVVEVSAEDAEINADAHLAAATALLDGLELTDLTTSTDVDLPTAGGRVTWTTSDPDVVTADGTVTAPVAGEPAATADLTATATVRGVSATRTITVTVEPSDETPQDRAERQALRYVVPPVLASGATLPGAPEGSTVAFGTITGAGVTLSDGVVVSSAAEPVAATVPVVVTTGGIDVARTFAVTVLPQGSPEILAYHRTPTSAAEANNADVALSVHLALGADEGYEPLNENYGIFFPRTSQVVPPGGTSSGILRSLVNPHVFYLSDGSFGVVATRTARNGGADGTQTSQLLLATSADLRSYTEIGLVDLGVTNGVNEPAVIWDSAAGHYVVTWTSDAGIATHTTFEDLTDVTTRGAVQRGVVQVIGDQAEGGSVPNFASGNVVPVSDSVAQALQVRFGRISNTGVSVPDVTVSQGSDLTAADLPERADLAYDDGSEGSLAVTWDAEDVAGVDTDTPGTYEVTGSLKQTEYATPFADERADPSVFRWDYNGEQKFLMIATEDLNLNPVDPANGAHMPFRIADSIEDLSDEAIAAGRNTEVDLLVAGDTDAYGNVMTGCFWAPELHVIDGTLSVLFMPCYNGSNGRPDIFTGRASIIQLGKDAAGNDLDPSVAANWSETERVVRADGSILNPIQNISLDMTYFVDSGRSYYAWQQVGAVFIAEMDPSDPLRLTSDPVRIIVPEYAWDNTIAEGPNVLVRDGVLNMIYSGSTVGDSYTTGLVTAPAGVGADLTDPAVWDKLNYPIQKSGIFNGEWQLGTGHGMWSQDEDGNDLYVFHARTDNNGLSGRDTFVRRVHWAADGLPVLDMETAEEVAPGNGEVTTTVTVSPGTAPIEFVDVTPQTKFFDEITWLAERGVTTGWLLPDGTREFRPVTPVARDAMAAFLHRLAGSPDFDAPEVSPFTDVPTDNQFYEEIAWLADQGISTGWDNGDGTASFRPLDPIARDAMAAFLHRYAEGAGLVEEGWTPPAVSPFADVPTSNQFYAEISWLAQNEIATGWVGEGNDGTTVFRPLNPIHRDAMAAFMYRLSQLEG